jgi:tRNA(fMet)-specific endonuclease VapC
VIILDTDTLTLFFRSHPRVVEKLRTVTDEVAISIITQIEVLQGRFDSLMKAADGGELLRGQQRLQEAKHDLDRIPTVLLIDAAGAAEFDRLRENKKLKKIGRADLLIASITLANKATLVSRNLKHFRQVPGLQVENWVDG